MKEWDAVDAVLDGLGGAEPAAGMEGRVLARLAAEPVVAHGVRWRGWRWAWAMAVVVCAVGSGLVVRQRTVRVAGRKEAVAVKVRAVEGAPVRVATGDVVLPVRKRHAVVMRSRAVVQPGVRPEVATNVLESFPAPPMPLTRQERLLLRMLRGGEAGQLVATLSPSAEQAARSAETARFAAFFQPVPLAGDLKSDGQPPLRDTGLESEPPDNAGRLKDVQERGGKQ